jgi:imidazole glycerol phosphate synthase subunit HisF
MGGGSPIVSAAGAGMAEKIQQRIEVPTRTDTYLVHFLWHIRQTLLHHPGDEPQERRVEVRMMCELTIQRYTT